MIDGSYGYAIVENETLAGIGDKKVPGHLTPLEMAEERSALIIASVKREVAHLKNEGPVSEDYLVNHVITAAVEMALGLRPVPNIEGEQ